MMNSLNYKMARDDILITLAITDIWRYVLLKVGAWLLSVHASMYGRRFSIQFYHNTRLQIIVEIENRIAK